MKNVINNLLYFVFLQTGMDLFAFLITVNITIISCTPVFGTNAIKFNVDLQTLINALSLLDNVYVTLKEGSVEDNVPVLRMKIAGTSHSAALKMPRKFNTLSKPSVELAPGTFKNEIVQYPPNYYQNRLKMLLKLQQTQDQEKKN